MRLKPKSLSRIGIALVAALILYVGWTAWAIWTFPCHEETRADAAIVLGHAEDRGLPSPVFAERINHGLALYRKGLVGKLVFTGGTPDGEQVALAEVAARYARDKGIPDADMILERYSRITYENLDYAKQLAGEKGLRTYLVVSDPLHMRRAMRMAADLGMDAKASPRQRPGTRASGAASCSWSGRPACVCNTTWRSGL